MLLASGIKRYFWNEAVVAANYLKNRCPTSALGEQFVDKTPAELWYGTKPDLSDIRIFGSTCYNHIPADYRKKLDAKSSKCIMIGYGTSHHTYRLWDLDANKLVIGRHVTFDERSILNKAKLIEISDSEAESEQTNKNDDETLVDTINTTDEHFTDKENIIIDNSVSTDCTDNRGNIELRKSNRERKPVQHYGDWEYSAHFALSAQEYVQNDPTSIQEAKQLPDWPNWENAIQEEYASLIKNGTWSLCDLPKGRKLISNKWVFKLKHKSNGDIDKYKARLVARGFTQEKGLDYNETYSPTAKLTTFRVLLVIAVHYNYHVHQMDVKCAFLNGVLNEDIYMNQPEGFTDGTLKVCKLEKSLYGLKQASRMWNERFHQFMKNIEFKSSLSDRCLYIRVANGISCYVLLYVDDLLIVCSDIKTVETVKQLLSREFEMIDIGKADTFLGIHIEQDENKISMNQTEYCRKMLQKFNMTDCKDIATPIENGIALQNGKFNNCREPYRELMGCLTYATLTTRPDLCVATNYFSRFQCCYENEHFKYAKRILRYIQGTKTLKMVYKKQTNAEPLVGYVDADWAGDRIDRKSTSGYVFKVFGNVVSWSTRKQSTVSLSSTEAEYIALASGICEGKWLRSLLNELNIECGCTTIYEDNQSCIKVAEESREHRRMKHIDVKYNFIRESIANGDFKLKYIRTEDQLADIMTKGLNQKLFVKHRANLNLSN